MVSPEIRPPLGHMLASRRPPARRVELLPCGRFPRKFLLALQPQAACAAPERLTVAHLLRFTKILLTTILLQLFLTLPLTIAAMGQKHFLRKIEACQTPAQIGVFLRKGGVCASLARMGYTVEAGA